MRPGGVYIIVDTAFLGERSVHLVARDVLEAGADIIQLRAKAESPSRVLEIASTLLGLAEEYKRILILNDRIDLALMSGAHGVHLGQEDLPIEAAREIAGLDRTSKGEKFLIGISTHSIDEAMAAENGGADYIGFGPVFKSTTKMKTGPQGLQALTQVVESVNIPVIAIGGIGKENLDELLKLNPPPAGFAVISAVMGSDDPGGETKRLVEIFGKFRGKG